MTDKNKNLLARLLSALVLLPLVLWLVWQGGLWFTLLIAVASALCALELNFLPAQQAVAKPTAEPQPAEAEALSRKQRKKLRAALESEVEELELEGATITGAGITSVGAAFLLALLADPEIHLGFVSVKMVMAALVIFSMADALLFEEDVTRAPRRVGLAITGALYCGLLLSALIPLRGLDRGFWWIFLALTVTWANDTSAYFAGRFFGKRKLYPRISPSKTWEGFLGGALGSIVGAVVVQHFFLDHIPVLGAVIIGAGAAVLGPLGDLSESMLKRAFGAKDSGKLMPGHGGLLDRVDALLFNAPFVLLCARLLAMGLLA